MRLVVLRSATNLALSGMGYRGGGASIFAPSTRDILARSVVFPLNYRERSSLTLCSSEDFNQYLAQSLMTACQENSLAHFL